MICHIVCFCNDITYFLSSSPKELGMLRQTNISPTLYLEAFSFTLRWFIDSIYTLNKSGESIPPCLTPLKTKTWGDSSVNSPKVYTSAE